MKQETKAQYKRIQEAVRELAISSDYYAAQTALNKELNEILNHNKYRLHYLNTSQILHLIAMCSSHRPHQPYAILTSFSIMYDKSKE